MNFKGDTIFCQSYLGRCRGRLNFSILIGWIPMELSDVVGTEFDLPFDYFRQFSEKSEFILFDVADPNSIYKLRLIGFTNGVATLKIINIYQEQVKMWLYENEIKFGTDWGIIEFIGMQKNADLKLVKD